MSLYEVNYRKALNEPQYKAVMHKSGPCLVIAGAGSGKTRVLTYRTTRLIEDGVDPSAILLLTFTKKAASEMLYRASRLIDERCHEVSGGTFHGFAHQILRRYGHNVDLARNFTILDSPDSVEMVKMLIAEHGFKAKGFPTANQVQSYFSKAVNTNASLEEVLVYSPNAVYSPQLEELQEAYVTYKRDKALVDYDDLLVKLREVLQLSKLQRALSKKYQYIMVDEYQDTNKLQADVLQSLCSEHSNIMVVGDDSQSIYSFRGANFRNILDFPKLFKSCVKVTIEQNYRSTQPILAFTNAILEHAREKFSKKLFSDIKSKDRPIYYRARNEFDQADFILNQIAMLKGSGEIKSLKDIAVLFRAGFHSNELEIELLRRGLPFVKYGGLRFVESAHVKDAVALLRVLFNYKDVLAWQRVLNWFEGIGYRTADTMARRIFTDNVAALKTYFTRAKFGSHLRRLYRFVRAMQLANPGPEKLIENILKFYMPILQQRFNDWDRRTADLESLTNIAKSEKVETVADLLGSLALDANVEKDEEDSKDKLVLSTIHSAKGLEFKVVFIIYLIEGALPAKQSLPYPNAIEEERRLFYVAATRAQQKLYLIAPATDEEVELETLSIADIGGYSKDRVTYVSRFLREIKNLDELAEKVTTRLTGKQRGSFDEI